MTVKSLELTMTLTKFLEKMKKSQDWGKDCFLTEGRRGFKKMVLLWRLWSDQREKKVKMEGHPNRNSWEARFSSSFA